MKLPWKVGTLLLCVAAWTLSLAAQKVERARALGVPFEGAPGHYDAITDVPGVEVGYTTLISHDGKLKTGSGSTVAVTGPVRTGVTAILPRGKNFHDPVFAGFFSQNGAGEMTGIHWVKESGVLEGPIMITSTDIVGTVRDAVVGWELEHGGSRMGWSTPVVAETWDGFHNGLHGYTLSTADTWRAIDSAASGSVAEGDVGGGAAMNCLGFKGGSGTASRVLPALEGGYTVGVFVQCNTGSPVELRIAGVPVGQLLHQKRTFISIYGSPLADLSSIIIVIATNAPLDSIQLDRLCKRATLGLGRVGGTSGNGSGDLFVSFSTANPGGAGPPPPPHGKPWPHSYVAQVERLPDWAMDPIFNATIQATEEAIVNALVGAKTITGNDGKLRNALPHTALRRLMQGKYPPTAW
ncbi:MAG: P1 family peptidase [Acidobacteriaceae bacterium]